MTKSKYYHIDHAVKNSKALFLLTKGAQGTTNGQLKELKGILPKVHKFSMYDQEAMIATYSRGKLSDGNTPTPRVLLLNDRVYPLNGWCSFDEIAVFSLNGLYYICSGSACCDCGISILELIQVTQDGLVMVRSDASLSD